MSTIAKKYQDFVAKNETNYFAFISMTILIGSIWGGIAAMFIDKNNAPGWQLAINIGISMASNIAAIGQASLKWVINLFTLAFIVNAILILMNAF